MIITVISKSSFYYFTIISIIFCKINEMIAKQSQHYFSLFYYYSILIFHYSTIIFSIIFSIILLLFISDYYFTIIFTIISYYCRYNILFVNYFNYFTLQVPILWGPASTNTGPVNQNLADNCIEIPSVALCA